MDSTGTLMATTIVMLTKLVVTIVPSMTLWKPICLFLKQPFTHATLLTEMVFTTIATVEEAASRIPKTSSLIMTTAQEVSLRSTLSNLSTSR